MVLGSVGLALAGRRDLPSAFRYAGLQVGRVVGLLQGARARADRFTTQNELRHLQNELRSGLRELDQVKTELVVAASMGRTVGATTSLSKRPISSRTIVAPTPQPELVMSPSRYRTSMGGTSMIAPSVATGDSSIPNTEIDGVRDAKETMAAAIESLSFAPSIQSERASMEEEWEKKGMSFRSIAEQGLWINDSSLRKTATSDATTGSETLERIMQQNLVFDQYDRVIASQEHELEQKIKDIETKGRSLGRELSNNEV